MRHLPTTAAAVLVISLLPELALAARNDKPITDRDPDAMDVAKTPITDLNVGRDGEIPALLVLAVAEPYTLKGLDRCRQIATAIGDLNQVLGPDIDLPQEGRDRINAGRLGQWAVASFIPFRGLIREVSGANAQDRKVNAAIQAGLARRGFLKGVGEAKGCRYPAAAATPEIVQTRLRELEVEGKVPREDKGKGKARDNAPKIPTENVATAPANEIAFRSEPEVQQPAPRN